MFPSDDVMMNTPMKQIRLTEHLEFSTFFPLLVHGILIKIFQQNVFEM